MRERGRGIAVRKGKLFEPVKNGGRSKSAGQAGGR